MLLFFFIIAAVVCGKGVLLRRCLFKGTAVLAVLMVLMLSLPAAAAPVCITDVRLPGGAAVFDAAYYAVTNPEVVEEIGADPKALEQHFITTGRTEGREGYLRLSSQEIVRRIEAMRAVYPEGMVWGNGRETYSRLPSTRHKIITGTACVGFAIRISNAVFGETMPFFVYTRDAEDPCWLASFERIEPGDILYYSYDSGKVHHAVMVISNDGTKLTVCEGNFGGTVHWGKTITLVPGPGNSPLPRGVQLYEDDILMLIKRQI